MATYEKDFKAEAVQLSDDIGVKQAAAQLGIPYWTLADWRAARKARGSQAFVGSGHKRLPTDEKEHDPAGAHAVRPPAQAITDGREGTANTGAGEREL